MPTSREPDEASQPTANSERLVSVPGSTLPSRSYGDPADPALILLMGNTMPGGFWPPRFCAALAATGLHVTEYDYRDVGGSTLGAFAQEPYDLLDLADDVLAIADALGRERIHLAGLSMGGFLSLLTALRHPDRVASVTSMMSTERMRKRVAHWATSPIHMTALDAESCSRTSAGASSGPLAMTKVSPKRVGTRIC